MVQPDFDEIIDRTGTHCSKWDDMQAIYGVSPQDGIAMWVADMDFRPPASVQRAVEAMAAHGVYGYPGANPAYLEAIRWWMETRHGWQIEPDWILSAHGLVNGTAVCVDAFTRPGDRVIVMTPVYHAFARVIRASGREVAEFPLAIRDGQYRMDWEGWRKLLTGRERMLILCSPHNPGGRVWSAEELREVADFCAAHDLILVSDEIHHDLVLPGSPRHSVLATVAPEAAPRLVTLTAATKTFNIAGAHIGNLIVADEGLRKRLQTRLMALGISPGLFGPGMVAAAYSPEGAAWVDALVAYLDGNRRLFDEGVNIIPGLRSMPLQATYLAWLDFSGTGMERAEFTRRVEHGARIAVNHGGSFGTGGEDFLRFNIATPRARVAEAVARLQEAFRDLQ
ncbi:MalY/PatB family protein [Paracoccus sp. P2]|uniref:cysteine-S-conjugate beta-lyase n=1 Tax=Paracoccus pantotrophus TaxID=82367 RepID=A0A1I5F1V0_PARPN|nr:MalY/PatB family protein [Paracoccus pantotrophus]MDF3853334.1 pyridoxal phosphate-dependent aminotransferase [Paracoccus pantotrophus]QFG37050.1 pyridoxal phosphate-dependent aminotransferase [Paracoccus pantotrophus]QLH14620.1 pyridoxal phosphate-dependent aminotransferase [Paracoccus pantotrophus]RDD98504.1 pyridoxal phosphate-dependent aminotransferase [Paracoccus pantotrophus]RKS52533.1 cystathionine beta-lyase [Paracoccus pantotrophus]